MLHDFSMIIEMENIYSSSNVIASPLLAAMQYDIVTLRDHNWDGPLGVHPCRETWKLVCPRFPKSILAPC